MIDTDFFRRYGHELVEWIATYYENIEKYPVKSRVKPRSIFNQLPNQAPIKGENMEHIMVDFNTIIMPGITHWQHPQFHAYFPSNTSFPSILAEMLTSALAAQCMKWETSPAAAELEEMVMNWLRELIGLPGSFHGVIQDTASTATLCAILTAREKSSQFNVNQNGLGERKYRVYCSDQAHSSVEKAVKISGIGRKNLIKINVDKDYSLIPSDLVEAIEKDKKAGFEPMCVVAAIGTTSSTAIDPLKEIGEICKKYNIWLHVDAAYAGSALILPEFRWMINGIEYADSFVFNPHKWLLTNFDCSAYFLKDKNALLNTFELIPEYLKTRHDGETNDYGNWGIQLGRRFRALKLWFVLRSYGVEGLQEIVRKHIALGKEFAKLVETHPDFEILAPVVLNLTCFRFKPSSVNADKLNDLNERLLSEINKEGKMYITHTVLNGSYSLRFLAAQAHVEKKHIDFAWQHILECCKNIV